MKKETARFLLAAALAAAVFSGCGGSFVKNQLRAGIWASEKDLWDEAAFRWKKVLSQDPNSVAAHNNLAVACEKRGLWDEAEKEYELASKLDPKNTQIKFNYDRFKENREALKKSGGADEVK
jgi:tetratricopeptide (TPR) repeat protein